MDKVAYWTGVQRPVVKKLVESIARASGSWACAPTSRLEREHLTEVSVVRDGAGDELPDARKVRAAVRETR